MLHRGNSEEILEEILSVALLSPACFYYFEQNLMKHYVKQNIYSSVQSVEAEKFEKTKGPLF
jgi:hypothetical protein